MSLHCCVSKITDIGAWLYLLFWTVLHATFSFSTEYLMTSQKDAQLILLSKTSARLLIHS